MSTRELLTWVCCLALCACQETRDRHAAAAPAYGDVAAMLRDACAACHGERTPAAGYAVGTYLAVIGCLDDGRIAVEPRDGRAPLLRVLEREDHRGLLSRAQRDQLSAWIQAGAPANRASLHAVGILDPRSDGWHGMLAAEGGFRALRDADSDHACGRCHAGAPATPSWSHGSTAGATACTECHGEPDAVLACSTCHGRAGKPFPPRDACYFGGAQADPHAAHVERAELRAEPFVCSTCHTLPGDDLFAASHTDGKVDVTFDGALAGAEASFDRAAGTCAVECHARGGERAEPGWRVSAPLDCQSCHATPPPQHYVGDCYRCHDDMSAQPDQLRSPTLHINGRVDLGDGRGSCGSCHGEDEVGAPADIGHQQHLQTVLTSPIRCSTCHDTPELGNLRRPLTHMNGELEVHLSGPALGLPEQPRFDAAQRTCSNVACHSTSEIEPRWGEPSRTSAACVACHATPPPPPHSQLPGCGGALCHGSEVAPQAQGFRITESGRTLHIDGALQAGPE
jgi:predicted CxxxxCH...CXXCH cytochrome family protein